jgi:hypothetical protein
MKNLHKIVRPVDGSYSMTEDLNGKLVDCHGLSIKGRLFRVVEEGGNFPTENFTAKMLNKKLEVNDTKMIALDNDQVVYIQGRFLVPVMDEQFCCKLSRYYYSIKSSLNFLGHAIKRHLHLA